MIWAGSASAASWHPATSPFAHQPVFNASTNPLQFSALHTLSSDGNLLTLSFQQLPHSSPSHGTGPSNPPIFEFRFSNFAHPLTPFFATLTDFVPCKSFVCHSYKNEHPIRMLVLSERQRVEGPLAKSNVCHSYEMRIYKSFVCHSYENTGDGTNLFPFWNSTPTCAKSPSIPPCATFCSWRISHA
jgi:hypothetical protein